jgi:WD40-like Beta Propeller Repeat/Kelch motif
MSIVASGERASTNNLSCWAADDTAGLARRVTRLAAAPDGSFLVFSSAGAPNSLGASDLYFAQLMAPEWWSAWPWNLGLPVNSREDEVDPSLSADGKRLYFCRSGDIYEIDLVSARQPPAESAAWKSRGDMPTPREWPQAVVANGRIVVYGGMSGGFATGKPHGWNNQVEVYDPATVSWSALAPAPEGWKQASLVVVEDRLVLFRRGGPGVAEYIPASKRWEVIRNAMSFTIGEASPFQTRTVVLGRKAYTMFAGGQVRDISYLVEYNFDTDVWTPRKSMPFKTAQLVAFEDRLYAFADAVSVYEPRTDQWTVVARMDMPRAEAALVVHNGEVWLIGGHGVRADGVDGDICPTVARFNPQRNAWSRGPALPWLRAAASAASVNGRLFLLGGLKPGPAFAHDASVFEYVPGQ